MNDPIGKSAMKVTTADFIKNYGRLADKALSEPLTITKNGHDRLVVMAADEYHRLKRRDRQVIRTGDLTDEEVRLIAQAEVPANWDGLIAAIKAGGVPDDFLDSAERSSAPATRDPFA
jgi:PHD/YefM family antitoxin component YafN of YafNO toxin-antitoxin module